MPIITQISEQKRRANRRNIYLDGQFAFGCNLNVVAKFRLRQGLELTQDQIHSIEIGEVRQECFDSAMRYLESRLHATAEMRRKLMRKEFGPTIIDGVIEDLTRLGYLDDAKFARAKAQSAADHKKHGKRRAKMELMRAGIKSDVADRALNDVYDSTDTLAVARSLVEKMSPRLRKLAPEVARRRLIGMLQRRGFGYDDIRPLVAEFSKHSDHDDEQ